MNKIISLFILPLAFSLFLSCGNNSNEKKTEKDSVMVTQNIPVPDFNADSAYHFVGIQTEFGPRVPNTPAHSKCALWLEQKLNSYKAEVYVQKDKVRAYNGTELNMKNIIGSFNPDLTNRIMLCAHWDSRPYADWDPDSSKHRTPIDGANDGASGVGVLLEICRIISENKLNIGVDIIFFDAEDYGEPQDDDSKYDENNWGLGSQYWSRNPHKPNYTARYGILLDMVGVPDANFTKEDFSVQYAPDVVNKVWDAAGRSGYEKYFSSELTNPITDDHYFINTIRGLPTIDIIHHDKNTASGFYKYWHTLKDNLENVDKNSLKAVGQTLIRLIFEESASISPA